VATFTLANSPNSHQSLADIVRSFAPPSYAKPRPEFKVFATEKLEYHWRVLALATNLTVFPPQEPVFRAQETHAVDRTARREGPCCPITVEFLRFHDVKGCRAYSEEGLK